MIYIIKGSRDNGHVQIIKSLVYDLVSRGQFVGTKNLFVPYQNKTKLIIWSIFLINLIRPKRLTSQAQMISQVKRQAALK